MNDEKISRFVYKLVSKYYQKSDGVNNIYKNICIIIISMISDMIKIGKKKKTNIFIRPQKYYIMIIYF